MHAMCSKHTQGCGLPIGEHSRAVCTVHSQISAHLPFLPCQRADGWRLLNNPHAKLQGRPVVYTTYCMYCMFRSPHRQLVCHMVWGEQSTRRSGVGVENQQHLPERKGTNLLLMIRGSNTS